MFTRLLHTEVQQFIKNYEKPIDQLAFSGSPFKEVSVQELIIQIESRRKAKTKLPTWYKTEGIIFPPKLNLEQTSSETTAAYKSSIVFGKTLADITGGFGIDSYYFSKKVKEVHHFEVQESLSTIAKHNNTCLQKENIIYNVGDGIEHIKEQFYDTIYVDPSRRNDSKGKVFLLNDCEPNMSQHLAYLLKRCDTLLIKTSPMLDISIGMKELEYVKEIHVVAVQNEVKELLWICANDDVKSPEVHTLNFTNKKVQKFKFAWDSLYPELLDAPQKFLYEPNAAIMKSGAFNAICYQYKLSKLHKHSHLYTSNNLQEFPGRRFRINKILAYSKKEMRYGITFDKANITIRNFPESVARLRKKWHLKEGGDRYLFFTTIENEKKIVLICSKISHEN